MLSKPEFDALLKAAGATVVKKARLPAGPGVFADEVGGAGPWYGIKFDHGDEYGWARDVSALYDEEIFVQRVGPLVLVRRMASALLRVDRDAHLRGMLDAAHIVRHLRPSEACTCGGYISLAQGIPRHLPGCVVGECIDAADEIEGRAEASDGE